MLAVSQARRALGLQLRTARHVAQATGSDPLAPLVAGATYAVGDTGAALPGAPAVYEAHVIPPANSSQVFTVNYDALLRCARVRAPRSPPPANDGAHSPHSTQHEEG